MRRAAEPFAHGGNEVCDADRLGIGGETALTFPVGDAAALAEAMTRMASDAEMRARFGNAARALVETKFSAEAIGKETVALYQSLKPA